MARMREPRFKKCRSLDLNVTGHPKAMDRAGNGQARDLKKLSPFGTQLLEKQRLRGYYEVMEKQFKRYVINAIKSDELTGDSLVKSLESRLDNMVYRMHFGHSIRQARQMVVHGHMLVNGKKVDRPSYALKVGDVISLKDKSKNIERFKDNLESSLPLVEYISIDKLTNQGTYDRQPLRKEIPILIDDHLVIEHYSKII